LPALQVVIGVLFFLSLTFAGLSSFISINEVLVASFSDKLNLPRRKVVLWYTIIAGLVSLIFTTGAGLYVLDIADYFVNQFGVAMSGLVEVIVIGWMFKLVTLREHFEPISDFNVGKWWEFTVKFITPIILGITAIQNFYSNFTANYGGYAIGPTLAYGWAVALGILIIGIILGKSKWKDASILEQIAEDV
jgi:NSS family neurotransmitter:Na+ symporter